MFMSILLVKRERRLNRAGGAKQFVTVRESGTGTKANRLSVKMTMHREVKGEATVCVFSRVTFCFFLAWPCSSLEW